MKEIQKTRSAPPAPSWLNNVLFGLAAPAAALVGYLLWDRRPAEAFLALLLVAVLLVAGRPNLLKLKLSKEGVEAEMQAVRPAARYRAV